MIVFRLFFPHSKSAMERAMDVEPTESNDRPSSVENDNDDSLVVPRYDTDVILLEKPSHMAELHDSSQHQHNNSNSRKKAHKSQPLRLLLVVFTMKAFLFMREHSF